MKLSVVMQNINQALNYPSLSYIDIDLYFNAAIAELNTTLHTAIPSVSKMKEDFEQIMLKDIKYRTVLIGTDPNTSADIPEVVKYEKAVAYTTGDCISYNKKLYQVTANITSENNLSFESLNTEEITELLDSNSNTIKFFFNEDMQLFGIWSPTKKCYFYYKTIYGVYYREGVPERYISYYLGVQPIWIVDTHEEEELDFSAYLPDDWVYLWLIPYICYKYTVRDGGTAQTFAEELTQGFQQLQETYNVPSKVILATVAGKVAYSKEVEENLNNLLISIPTKAIYEEMKHSRNVNGIYGSMYDRGGFL